MRVAATPPPLIAPGTIQSLFLAIIRQDGDATARLDAFDPAVACAEAEHHGLVALVADALDDQSDAPPEWRARFGQRARDLAAIDIVKESEFLALLDDFEAADHPVLLIKGAQLAYTLYARPDLRARIDSDLLIPAASLDRAQKTLETRGYVAVREQQEGDLLRHQLTFVKITETTRHTVDLHWRVLDPQVFAHVLDYDTVVLSARPIPRLGPGAQGLHPAHALLLACVHRVAHHRGHRPLIWIYDIHLLAASLSDADWEKFLVAAERMRVAGLCAQGLALAEAAFATRLPEAVRHDRRLTSAASDASARYLRPTRRAESFLGDIQALPRWRQRARLVSQYLFPPARYMRDSYAPGSTVPLPWLYAVRVWRGAGKWLAKPPRE